MRGSQTSCQDLRGAARSGGPWFTEETASPGAEAWGCRGDPPHLGLERGHAVEGAGRGGGMFCAHAVKGVATHSYLLWVSERLTQGNCAKHFPGKSLPVLPKPR